MPACSEELSRARREEIINACAELYRTMSFKEVTIKEIGRRTSFTRTSIYNYFQTREEIFLALFRREYELWTEDIAAIERGHETLSEEEFADALARTLTPRGMLLKLMSMNLYDMEDNSSLEALVEFKRSYARMLETLSRCAAKFFPRLGDEGVREFVYGFIPFLFGVYPLHLADGQAARRDGGRRDPRPGLRRIRAHPARHTEAARPLRARIFPKNAACRPAYLPGGSFFALCGSGRFSGLSSRSRPCASRGAGASPSA